jgi:hypothetical protein
MVKIVLSFLIFWIFPRLKKIYEDMFKEEVSHTHKQKTRDIRDGKYVDSNGKTMIKQTDEDMKGWNSYLEESESKKRGVVKETPKKKKHFSKGVNPDFL